MRFLCCHWRIALGNRSYAFGSNGSLKFTHTNAISSCASFIGHQAGARQAWSPTTACAADCLIIKRPFIHESCWIVGATYFVTYRANFPADILQDDVDQIQSCGQSCGTDFVFHAQKRAQKGHQTKNFNGYYNWRFLVPEAPKNPNRSHPTYQYSCIACLYIF